MTRQAPAGYEDVGRSTIYGNPYRIGQTYTIDGVKVWMHSAGTTIPYFERYARERMRTDEVYAKAVRALKGKKLWCPGCGVHSATCHARVLEVLART